MNGCKLLRKSSIYPYILSLICIILAVLCRLLNGGNGTVPDYFFWLLRPFLYIGLYSAWAISFSKRIVHRQTRRCLTAIAMLMIFWIFIRTCKYMSPDDWPAVLRFLWYLYYIPMLMIPTVGRCLSLYIRKSEAYELSDRKKFLLFAPPAILVALVLTNDLHQIVFRFPEGEIWTDKIYEHGIGYYIIVLWIIGCGLRMLGELLLKCRISRGRKVLWLPFTAFGISLLYMVWAIWHPPLWKLLAGDMTAAFCVLFAMIIESCIICGLIPSNTEHEALFWASDIEAQIIDKSCKIRYSPKKLETISEEVMKGAVKSPVMQENGIRLLGAPIGGGYILWREDVSELQNTLEELEEAREDLKDANLVEEENLKAKKRIAQLAVKNSLYDQVQCQTARQIELLSGLINRYPFVEYEKKGKILSKITVIGAYLKRRSNLIFITSQSEEIPVRELTLCMEETMRNLTMCGVYCSFTSDAEGTLAGKAAMRIYDLFERILEQVFDGLTVLYVHLKAEGNRMELSMSVECETNLPQDLMPDGVEAELDFDGAWLISAVVDKGGAV